MISDGLERRFEAIVFAWDAIAASERRAAVAGLARVVEEAALAGLELAVVSSVPVEDVDGQLATRPAGPGGLALAVDRGSKAHLVDRDGPQPVDGRSATAEEDAALSLCAGLTVERLAARGLVVRIVSAPPNRRVAVLPEHEWKDPCETRIDELEQLMRWLWRRGNAPEQTFVVGDESACWRAARRRPGGLVWTTAAGKRFSGAGGSDRGTSTR